MKSTEIRQFRDLIRRLQRSIGWQAKSDADCCGITIAQCHALLEIGNKQELSLTDLAEVLGLDPSTLSRTIETMVAGGLVNRNVNPDDRRYVALSLSAKGRATFDRINQTYDHYYQTVFARIPADKHDQLMESFNLLTQAVVETERISN